jgi:hypothetical protein
MQITEKWGKQLYMLMRRGLDDVFYLEVIAQ